MRELVVPLKFLVIESSPYDVTIGLPRMVKLRVRPDYYRLVLKVHFESDSKILNHRYERKVGHTSEDESTSDDARESNNDDKSDEGLVLMLRDGKTNAPDCEEEELINEKLCHLNQKSTEGMKSILSKYPEVIANLFEDVPPSTVAVTNRFELTSNNPIYQKARRTSTMHNEIVCKEVDRMLATAIITTIESSRTSPVTIATKKDGSSGSA